jgi:AcrR family transcriptional regulator
MTRRGRGEAVLRSVRMSKAQSTKREPKRGPKPPAAAKRVEKRELVRGEPVVQRVLAATMEELALVGYRALRVEDVAVRAEVNKTTVYRRWPEKGALVRDALGCLAKRKFSAPDTGTLRGDLLSMGRVLVELWSSPQGQSVVRMLVAEGSDAGVAALRRSLRRDREPIPEAVIAAAVARGELAPDVDHRLLFQAFVGALQHRIFFMNEPAGAAFLQRLVDLLLGGARSSRAPAPARRRPAH